MVYQNRRLALLPGGDQHGPGARPICQSEGPAARLPAAGSLSDSVTAQSRLRVGPSHEPLRLSQGLPITRSFGSVRGVPGSVTA